MVRYTDLSELQRIEICNGCGGKGGWVKPPHAKFFEDECNWHDFNYFLGFTEEHRKKAELQLRAAMLRKIRPLAWYWRIRYTPWCYMYYQAVRIAGKKYFFYGTKEQEL